MTEDPKQSRPDDTGDDPADDETEPAPGADTEEDARPAEIPPPADFADGDDAAAGDPAASPPVRGSRATLLIALFALLLAAVAAGAAAFLWLDSRTPDPESVANASALAQLEAGARDTNRELQQARDALEALRGSLRSTGADVAAQGRDLDARLRPLEALPGRLSSLEASLAALQGISSGLRDTWLLAEAEYYLQIANAQLQLAANPELARIALELADERLASLGNPALTDVRRALADEIRQLEALGSTDVEGAVLALASLAGALDSLALKADVVARDTPDAPVDAELSGIDRAWASLKNSLSDVISVRRTDQPVTPLLPPDAAYFLRSNLALQLQAARLALLRGEQLLFEQSLADAARWIEEYYDTDSLPVRSALQTIDELRATRFRASPPDISRSLALLRQYVAVRASERRRAPAGNDGPQQ